MNRSRLFPLLAVAALVLIAWQPTLQAQIPSTVSGRSQGVDITSHVRATTADGAAVSLTLQGVAIHNLTGVRVIFTAKQLVAIDPGNFGPVTVTLNPRRESVGRLSSRKFPATHTQSFFLQIHNERWGTLVSDRPLVLSARIESTQASATYKSAGGDVAFHRVDDPGKTVLTIHEVSSDVKPATSTAVDIKSRVTATVAGKPAQLQLNGTATHFLSFTSVIFNNKLLRLVDPGPIGPIRVTLNPSRPSTGTLSSPRFPATHRQSFFLQLQSERLGTLVSDDPIVVSAQIQSSPPENATYKSEGKPVAFYKRGDKYKKTVLTFDSVESEVSPPRKAG